MNATKQREIFMDNNMSRHYKFRLCNYNFDTTEEENVTTLDAINHTQLCSKLTSIKSYYLILPDR